MSTGRTLPADFVRGTAPSVAVVGAGLGGLSAAVRLASLGAKVTVYEQQSLPGGKAGSETRGGYRFDTGPSLLTMPYVIERIFADAQADWTDYLRVEKLEVICNYFWQDGTRLHAYGDPERFAAEVEAKLGEPAEHVLDYLEYTRRIHEAASELFLWNSLHDRRTYLSRLFWSRIWRLGRIDAMRTMHSANASFFRDPRLVQLFDRYATYNGSSPYRTPATLNIIPFVEYVEGGYAVNGGIHALPRALERFAGELGVDIRYGERVDRIVTEARRGRRGSRVRGVEVGARFVPADVVVSNVDVSVTYPQLLADERSKQLRRYRSFEPSSSGLVFYWGIRGRFPELTVNNILFGSDYEAEFRALFDERRCPSDPTIYVNITSKVTPSDAPDDGENWFILVNAPYVDGQDWASESARMREIVIRRVSTTLVDARSVEGMIEEEGVMTPEDIARRTMSYRGALYGISSNSRLAAFARHPNRSPDYASLYFCGGSTHPGGGMPLAMLSGRIAADLIRYDHA